MKNILFLCWGGGGGSEHKNYHMHFRTCSAQCIKEWGIKKEENWDKAQKCQQ